MPTGSDPRPTADALLARIQEKDRARLRIYIGAAPGVGKTYEMLQEAHALRARGVDAVVGYVETFGRRETEAQLRDLEIVPRRQVEHRGVTLEEMDVDAIIAPEATGVCRRRARAQQRAGQPAREAL